jgi:hypothetical protein
MTSCTHPDPIPLQSRKQAREGGRMTSTVQRRGSICPKCKSWQIGENGPWVGPELLARLLKQATCKHEHKRARIEKQPVEYREDEHGTTKVQPLKSVGTYCQDCDLKLAEPKTEKKT